MRAKREDKLIVEFTTGESAVLTDGTMNLLVDGKLSAKEEIPREVAEEIISLLEDWLSEGKLK